jgi:hypothetical protein
MTEEKEEEGKKKNDVKILLFFYSSRLYSVNFHIPYFIVVDVEVRLL